VPVLTALWRYPIKSCRGEALAAAALSPKGLPHDREWMVVDERGLFVTQRTEGRLARVVPTLTASALVVDAPDARTLVVPLEPGPRTTTRTVTVWRDTLEAFDEGPEAAAWFSALLGQPCRLVRQRPDCARQAGRKAPGAPVSFADAYPLLVTSEASLADLNTRLAAPVPMRAFRPNLVLSGAAPWAEDGWRSLAVAEARLEAVKPCARCVIPSLDPDTGRPAHDGLLRVLNALRPGPDGPLFGVNLAVSTVGEVAVGDEVAVQATPRTWA
jgi:uncharacterized protein YcbX